MKIKIIITIFLVCLLQSCSPSRPQVAQGLNAIENFDHKPFEQTSCLQCHEMNRPKTVRPHGDNLNCIECHKAEIGVNGKRSWLNFKNFKHMVSTETCNKCHLTPEKDSRPIPKENHPTAKYSNLDCVVCHQYSETQKSWKEITFNQATHSPNPKSCNPCHEATRPTSHTINPKTAGMKSTDCFACHGSYQDWKLDLKQFDHANSAPQTCLQCHKNDGPKPIENHPSKKEAYNRLECVLCHSYDIKAPSDKKSWKNIIFDTKTHSQKTTTCFQCHNNIVNVSLPKNGSHKEASRKNLDCNQCHTFDNGKGWGSFKTFDHKKLESGESCESCHNENTKLLKFKTTKHFPTKLQCVECHTTNAWKPATFKHQVSDTQCLSCHNAVSASGKPASHTLKTQVECSVCHSQNKWSPAWYDEKYTHSNNGYLPPLQFGKRITNHKGMNKCSSCHETKTDSVKFSSPKNAPTCLGCHQQEFQGEFHRGSEARRMQNCLECHNYRDWDR